MNFSPYAPIATVLNPFVAWAIDVPTLVMISGGLVTLSVAAWLQAPPDNGPRFARLLTRVGTPRDLPRPSVTPIEVKTRLMHHFNRGPGLH